MTDSAKTIVGTIWVCPVCGHERRRRVVSVDRVNRLLAAAQDVLDAGLVKEHPSLDRLREAVRA